MVKGLGSNVQGDNYWLTRALSGSVSVSLGSLNHFDQDSVQPLPYTDHLYVCSEKFIS